MQDDEFVRIAVIAGVHGLSGRLKIQVTSDIAERFEKNKAVYIKLDRGYRKFNIINYSHRENRAGLLELDGINDIDSAILVKGLDICIEKSEAEKTRSALLGEDSYYYYDIIGCDVYYAGGLFGTVKEIMETGAAEILVIENGAGKNFMVPFVEMMVDTSEIRRKKLTIHPVEGLIEV